MMRRVPFEIVQDTREQTPLVFDGVPVRRAALRTGDYSITGYEDEFTVERKSLEDLVSTVIHDRQRFIRELERMRSFRFKRLLVVAPYEAVSGGWGDYPFSLANPKAVLASVRAFEVRYDLPVTFARNSREAAQVVVEWARYYARERAIEDEEDAELYALFGDCHAKACA